MSAGTVVLVQIYLAGDFCECLGVGQGPWRWILQSSFQCGGNGGDTEKTPDILDIPNPGTCAIKNGESILENTIFYYNEKNNVFENF